MGWGINGVRLGSVKEFFDDVFVFVHEFTAFELECRGDDTRSRAPFVIDETNALDLFPVSEVFVETAYLLEHESLDGFVMNNVLVGATCNALFLGRFTQGCEIRYDDGSRETLVLSDNEYVGYEW